jgi:hypothetical protein
VGALGLLPLGAPWIAGRVRQGATAAGAVLLGGAFAALVGAPFPLGDLPGPIDFAETTNPLEAAGMVVAALAAHPGLPVLAVVTALAFLGLEPALGRGLWGLAGWASAFLAAAVIAPALAGGDPRIALIAPGIWVAAVSLGAGKLRHRS